MRTALVITQGVTFVALGALLLKSGDWRLGVAQLLLAGCTILVYT